MKKNSLALLCSLFVLYFSVSCTQFNNHKTSLSVSESQHDYYISTHFDKNKTRDVEHCMNDEIGDKSNMSFVNAQIDGKITLDDHTTFYLKKEPGFLEIKFNKDENSTASYIEIKDLAAGLKKAIN